MKQTIEQRRLHHQTREDRQRKVYGQLLRRIEGIRSGQRWAVPSSHNLTVYVRDATRLAQKLNIESAPPVE